MSRLGAPLIAVGLAASALAILSIPGVLDYGESSEARRIEAAVIDSLISRKSQLDDALARDCEQLAKTAAQLLPSSPNETKIPPAIAAALPRAAPSEDAGPGQAPAAPIPDLSNLSLLDRLERGIVMVIAGNALGTGFFVTPDTIVTNRHVVENATDFLVFGKYIGKIEARLIGIAGRGKHEDFAALRVTSQSNVLPFAVKLPDQPLTQVFAAGFPTVYIENDPACRRLMAGEASASVECQLVVTNGIISHLQRDEGAGVTLVVHGAEISHGNSGGPLTDSCGSVYGVNSYGVHDEDLPIFAKYALGTDGLLKFLASIGVQPRTETSPCTPGTPMTRVSGPPIPPRR